MKVVVSDSSPLIALLNIQRLDLLGFLFSEIIIPPAVANEIERGEDQNSPWYSLKQSGFIHIENIQSNDSRLAILELQLDLGESEAILLADQLKLPLLIDERVGRNMAKAMGLEIVGLVGVLYALKNDSKILPDEMRALVTALEKVNFWLSNELIELLLE